MGRYDNQKIFRDENGTRYLNRIQYPKIEQRDTDIVVKGLFGQRFENIAHKFYGNVELWWIIARANNENRGSMYVVPGKEYRIPNEIGLILQQFKELNK